MKGFLRNNWKSGAAAGLSLYLWLGIVSFSCAETVPTIRSGPQVSTELWEGKVLTATFRAGMCFEADGKARGVLILRHAKGQEDVYHLYGTMHDNEFSLSHSSGHKFSGSLENPEKMEGKVKLGNGIRLSMKGIRRKNVPLAAPDCAPLPVQK